VTTGELRAVLFDFDGTLWDSETAVFRVMRDLYRRHGQELSLETWAGAIGTLSGFDPYAALGELTDVGPEPEIVREETEERIREAVRRLALRPFVEGFLRQVDEAGVPRALVSSDTQVWIRTNLEHLGCEEGWAAIVCADGVVAHSKPSPHLYRTALATLGASPSSAFAVEDSPNGIRAAKAAGLRCACVPNDVTVQLDLSEADVVYPSFEGLTVEGVWTALIAADVPS
jgi:HAD superfamily hydrolase (TIGR01509 family)